MMLLGLVGIDELAEAGRWGAGRHSRATTLGAPCHPIRLEVSRRAKPVGLGHRGSDRAGGSLQPTSPEVRSGSLLAKRQLRVSQ